MAILYKIRDWAAHYENNRTREMKYMSWVPIPIKLSGNGYVHLMGLKDGPSIFGCFIAIVEAAASSKSKRGELWKTAVSPHSCRTLAAVIRQPEKLVALTIKTCSSADCDWIESVQVDDNNEVNSPAGCLRDACGMPAEYGAPYGTEEKTQNGTEEKTRKIERAPFVLISDAEYLKLIEKIGTEDKTKLVIEFFSRKKQMKGYKYKSDYLAILDWGIRAFEESLNLGVADGKRNGNNQGRFIGEFERGAADKYKDL